MRKRLRFFCFLVLLMSMLLSIETKADIMLPLWGQAIQNNCYLNIKIEDSNLTVQQRIEMKFKKNATEDYIYTFITKSNKGEFNEGSLSIVTAPFGLRDSIFGHGCKLQSLSKEALEETLEVVFEYEYQYPSENIGEILYRKVIMAHPHYGPIFDGNKCVEITCNQAIEVQEHRVHYSGWKKIGTGTHIAYHPTYKWGFLYLKISLPTYGETDTLEDRTFFELIPEHQEDIPNLIKNEFITIKFAEKGWGLFNYRLYGTIELDAEVAAPLAPFYAWFPNDHTNAQAKLECIYEHNLKHEIDALKVKPSVLDDQKGFYILIPELKSSSRPPAYGSRCEKATLITEIDGIQSENSCDFILVTAPQEYSSVKFKIPEKFSFGHCFSPFEHDTTYQDEEFKVKEFYGKCPSTGTAHVEWGILIFPDDASLFRNYPDPFNREAVIK